MGRITLLRMFLARARISDVGADRLQQLLQSMHHVEQLWDLGCA